MAQLLTNIIQSFFDSNGDPLVGGKLYSYIAGTSTPQATYTDQSGVTPNSNPVILDSNGQGNIWLSGLAYKFILKDSNDVTLRTVDNVSVIDSGSITTIKLADGSVTTPKLADNAVTTAKIIDDAVTADKIADDSVTLDKIGANQIELIHSGPGEFLPHFGWSSPIALANPAILPAGTGNDVAWSPDGKYLAVAHVTTPFITVYERRHSYFVKLDDPSAEAGGLIRIPAANANGAAWSIDGQFLAVAVANSGTPLVIYRKINSPSVTAASLGFLTGLLTGTTTGTISDISAVSTPGADGPYFDTDFNTIITGVNLRFKEVQIKLNALISLLLGNGVLGKLSGVATMPAGVATHPAWSTDGQFLAVASANTPFINIYQRSGTTFTKLSDPATLPPTQAECVAWSPLDGSFLAVGNLTTSPFLTIYSRVGTGFTKLSDPATLPPSDVNGVAFSPDNQFLAVAHSSSPFITIYQISGTTFTKLSNPTTLPTGNAQSVSWSSDSKLLAVAHTTTPFITIYSVSGTTFTKLTNPSTLPAGNANGTMFSPDGQFLAVAHATSPFVTVYVTSSGLPFSALLFTSGFANV